MGLKIIKEYKYIVYINVISYILMYYVMLYILIVYDL